MRNLNVKHFANRVFSFFNLYGIYKVYEVCEKGQESEAYSEQSYIGLPNCEKSLRKC